MSSNKWRVVKIESFGWPELLLLLLCSGSQMPRHLTSDASYKIECFGGWNSQLPVKMRVKRRQTKSCTLVLGAIILRCPCIYKSGIAVRRRLAWCCQLSTGCVLPWQAVLGELFWVGESDGSYSLRLFWLAVKMRMKRSQGKACTRCVFFVATCLMRVVFDK